MAFEHKVCLGDSVVPLVRRTTEVEDRDELVGGDADDQEFLFLGLNATSDMSWLIKHLKDLKLPSTFWKKRSREAPLVQELRAAIGVHRRGTVIPRRQQAVVPLLIRDKVIFAQNTVTTLAVAAKPGEELEFLTWFLEEITKDIQHLVAVPASAPNDEAEVAAPPAGEEPGAKRPFPPSPEREQTEALLQELREHPRCLSARYLPSRPSFRITRDDHEGREFFCKNLNKLRHVHMMAPRETTRVDIRTSMKSAVAVALEFLDS